ncbi:protein SFI1 homolog isoform X2 [Neopelma chrysocephalum]|uniref:protein SFI1 homolog isoform X2 n=1 Tax=Neopelma chrysocephalum TaxID=114329 RepID=UPI000FCCE418|nr:protein SFI1 homolog isoform X2 [Neopelma chrysocephalum]
MEKVRSSSKSLKMQEIQQPAGHRVHASGQSGAPHSARHEFQDRGCDNPSRVGCAQNQRRRLKRFRTRHLARKFFYLWAKMTFGQVLPSKARSFYEQKIVQKTFGQWKEWWTVCRERKLSLRAENHYRHFLYSLVLKAWRAYVCQQQGERNKYCVAESHAKKQKLLRSWQCWLVYVDVQRTKHGMQSVALAFRERSCLRVSWAVWRRQHYQKCTGHQMNILALQHWAQSLQFRAWLQWRELYLYSQNEKQKETRAVTHRRHWELRRCLGAWLGYLNLHRVKKRQNELAQELHRSRTLRRCFSDWRLLLECKRRIHAHQRDLEKQAARIALWRAFAHWKHYVVLCVEESRQCELAQEHYRHHLLKLGFKGLWQNVVNTRLQRMRKNLSHRQHQVTVLQKFWSRWKSRLEEKEEEQQQALTLVAHVRYRRVLMRWVFDTWLLKASKLQEDRMGEERAVLHFERQLLRCFWCSWRRRTAARLEEQEALVRARDHHSNFLKLKAFCLWKQSTQERQTERLREMQALRFHCSKCLQKTWNKWREYVGHQREKWGKLVRADLHYRQTLLGKTLAAWKSYQQNIQCVLYRVAEKEEEHTRLLLGQLLCTWRENALALIHEGKAAARADEHYRRAVLSKVLLQWRHTAWLRACHRQEKVTAVVEARKHLDTVRLQTLFLHWKELMRECLMLRAQHHRAVQHHQQHLLHKYLGKWKNYHQQCLEKTLLQRLGDQLMTHRLCSASFSCWKARLLQQQREKQQTVQALWHWSLSVQRKVFDAWLIFAKEQQEKKDGNEKGTGVHHTSFLREGGIWALRNPGGMKQLQDQLHAQHQLKQVTFRRPDVSPETRGHSAEEEPWPSKCRHLPLHPADGGSVLSDLNAIQRARLPPQRPDFLLESLESKELLGPPFARSEVPFQQTSVNKCSAQTGNLLQTPHLEESTCKCLSQTGSAAHSRPVPFLPRAAPSSPPLWTADVPRAGQGPELWSPASFMPQMKAGSEKREDQPGGGHKGAHSRESQQNSVGKLRPNLQPHVLSPEDLVGQWSHQTAAEGEEREHSSREEMVLQRKVEVELRHIQQQMQYYYSRKLELKSCQQQAQILQQWLELSSGPGARAGVQGVQEELGQLQGRINTLSAAQLTDRQRVQSLLARLREIQLALDL